MGQYAKLKFNYSLRTATQYGTTVGQFIDNIEKNGFTHIKGTLYTYDEKRNVVGACALGQGIANTIGPDKAASKTHNLETALSDATIDRGEVIHVCKRWPRKKTERFSRMVEFIVHMNDTDKLSLEQIVKTLRKEYAKYLNVPVLYEVYDASYR